VGTPRRRARNNDRAVDADAKGVHRVALGSERGDLSIWPHDTCGHLVGSKKSTSDAIHEMLSLSNLLVLPRFFTWSVRVLLVFLELTRDGGEKFFYVMCTLHSLSFTCFVLYSSHIHYVYRELLQLHTTCLLRVTTIYGAQSFTLRVGYKRSLY
jgi:hypothetical protein